MTDLIKLIESNQARSAWSKGVKLYALELLENLEGREVCEFTLLNGASSWSEYSYGGSALIYDADIAEHLCTPSELKVKKGGDLQPSKHETWLDVQARALGQACRLVLRLNKKASK